MTHQVKAKQGTGLLDGLLITAIHHIRWWCPSNGLRSRSDSAGPCSQLKVSLECRPASAEMPATPHSLQQGCCSVPHLYS